MNHEVNTAAEAIRVQLPQREVAVTDVLLAIKQAEQKFYSGASGPQSQSCSASSLEDDDDSSDADVWSSSDVSVSSTTDAIQMSPHSVSTPKPNNANDDVRLFNEVQKTIQLESPVELNITEQTKSDQVSCGGDVKHSTANVSRSPDLEISDEIFSRMESEAAAALRRLACDEDMGNMLDWELDWKDAGRNFDDYGSDCEDDGLCDLPLFGSSEVNKNLIGDTNEANQVFVPNMADMWGSSYDPTQPSYSAALNGQCAAPSTHVTRASPRANDAASTSAPNTQSLSYAAFLCAQIDTKNSR
jgi:hypothetical protein